MCLHLNKNLENIILLSIITEDNAQILNLAEDEFNFPETKWLYKRINDMYKSREEINIASVANGQIKVLNYLANIENNGLTSYQIPKQIEELKKLNKQRDIEKLVLFMNENKDFPNVLDDVQKLIEAINKDSQKKIVNLADVQAETQLKERYKSFIPQLDTALNGFQMGQLTIWTGKSGHGKSTFISQMLIEAVEQGYKVFSYSGELKLETFRNWLERQIAGEEHIGLIDDREYGRKQTTMTQEVLNGIRKWYDGKIYCYDNRLIYENAEANSVTNLLIEAILKNGCRVFLIDNLMTCSFENTMQTDYYKAQSDFVGKLSYIAKAYNVHIHLVAHPRKTKGDIEQDDISGTSDTFKRADNVISVQRNDDGSNTIRVMKCRETGNNDEQIKCTFLPKSKRFVQANKEFSKYRKYGWEKESGIECPF